MKKGSINPHLWKARIGKCLLCGKQFRAIKDFKTQKQKWCSKECWSKRNPKINNLCRYCEIVFKTYPSQKKPYCTQRCRDLDYSIRQKGKNSHFWRGGKTKESILIRSSAKYQEWRTAVFKRDNYTCKKCGIKGVYLQVDHIKQFAHYPELRFEISNGRTLCKPCHRKTNTYGNKSANSRQRDSVAGLNCDKKWYNIRDIAP